jgi:uncharacterized protein
MSDRSTQISDQHEILSFLSRDAEHIETHAAHVFLKGDLAFKMKKAIKLPYLDFSSPSLRRAALERELEINRRFAPDLYLHVGPIAVSTWNHGRCRAAAQRA